MRKLSFFPHKELSDKRESEVIPSPCIFSQTTANQRIKVSKVQGRPVLVEATKMRAPVGRADGRGMQVDASERAQQMGAVSVDPIPNPPDGRCLRWGCGGSLVGGSCMNLCTWGYENRGGWSLFWRERLCLRGRERRERSGVCRRGLNGPRPRGMRWAESTLEPAALPSWEGPNGQRKPPLAPHLYRNVAATRLTGQCFSCLDGC